jgi:glycerol kinase
MAGDQQAATFGQACFQPGMLKSTYGTGCFALLNTGERLVPSKNRLLSTIAWRLDGKPTYAIEGSIFIAGAAVQWVRDGLRAISHAAESEALARTLEDTAGSTWCRPSPGWVRPIGIRTPGARSSASPATARVPISSARRWRRSAYQTADLLTAMRDDIQAAGAGVCPTR